MPLRRLATTTLALFFTTVTAFAGGSLSLDRGTSVSIRQSQSSATVSFSVQVSHDAIIRGQGTYDSLSVNGEGLLINPGQPALPMVSRFVIVPPTTGVELGYRIVESHTETAEREPAVCILDGDVPQGEAVAADGLYPATPVEMSDPIVIRGVRMVKVTTYPVQYDASTRFYQINDRIETTLSYTDAPPINPAEHSFNRHYPADFKKVLRSIAANADEFLRDNPDDQPDWTPSHYLLVAHDSCIKYIAPFIEWKRKTGVRVDILSIPPNLATNAQTIKNAIQARYDAFLNAGKEPFDQILLVGDRRIYWWGPQVGWVLGSFSGESVWTQPEHGDYKFACLEGNDNYPDVGFARWCAGSPATLNLFVTRTLAYEATPSMADTGWFGRVACYSQHWGNDATSAWYPSIATTVRWAEQTALAHGFTDVRTYEDINWDQDGRRVGAFERQQFNDGASMMLGRAESLVFNQAMDGINENRVFPIRIALSGHGEYSTYYLLRGADPAHPRGPVAATCNWGRPATLPTNAVWLETVNGMIDQRLSYGWARTLAVTAAENYFSNFNVGADVPVYLHIKTDNDFYGDPGIKAWIGAPDSLEVRYDDTLTTHPQSLDVNALSVENFIEFGDAVATLYCPGNIPNPATIDYSTYNGMQSWSVQLDLGSGRIYFPEGTTLLAGTDAYLTITGENIQPFVGRISIINDERPMTISRYQLLPLQGNRDQIITAGETFGLLLTISNHSNQAFDNVEGRISFIPALLSPILNNRVFFGNVAPGAEVQCQDTLKFQAEIGLPDIASTAKHLLGEVRITHHPRDYWDQFELTSASPVLAVTDIPNGGLIPIDANQRVDIPLHNSGSIASPVINATLVSHSPELVINDGSATYQSIASGATGRSDNDHFRFSVNSRVVPGTRIPLKLALHADGTFDDTLEFEVQLGTPAANTPQAADAYGYLAYDNTDTAWANAPDYHWIEINPNDQNADFDGIRLPFEGFSPEDVGEMLVLPLPFPIGFYGQVYDTISICTNGYILPGDQARAVNFNNWPTDRGFGAGAGIIAPFWDWLQLGPNGAVFAYTDEQNGRIIIEWSRVLRHSGDQSELSFEVILYDRNSFPRESGDTDILFQYKQISDDAGEESIAADMQFASVGIGAPTGTTGISYRFRNSGPVTSAPLAARRAILFTTSIFDHSGILTGYVRDYDANRPLEDAEVSTPYGLKTTTDRNGRYTIENVVVGAPFSVTSRLEGYGYHREDGVVISENGRLELDLPLRRGREEVDPTNGQPAAFGLLPSYPNPFNGSVTLGFILPTPGRLRLSVYDLSGKMVGNVASGDYPAGRYRYTWDASRLPSGIYITKLSTGEDTRSEKLLLLR